MPWDNGLPLGKGLPWGKDMPWGEGLPWGKGRLKYIFPGAGGSIQMHMFPHFCEIKSTFVKYPKMSDTVFTR